MGVALTVGGLATLFVARLDQVPTVERVRVWPDTVRRGPMTRQARGTGTLAAEGAVLRFPEARSRAVAIVRQRVRFGRASINTIEIVEGLEPGDQVVLSDMSAWDGRDRVRLN